MMPYPQIDTQLLRLRPELKKKFGVERLAYFDQFLSEHRTYKCQLNIMVELKKPLGWDFFSLKEFLEKKLQLRIDICTPRSIKPAIRGEVNKALHYLW